MRGGKPDPKKVLRGNTVDLLASTHDARYDDPHQRDIWTLGIAALRRGRSLRAAGRCGPIMVTIPMSINHSRRTTDDRRNVSPGEGDEI